MFQWSSRRTIGNSFCRSLFFLTTIHGIVSHDDYGHGDVRRQTELQWKFESRDTIVWDLEAQNDLKCKLFWKFVRMQNAMCHFDLSRTFAIAQPQKSILFYFIWRKVENTFYCWIWKCKQMVQTVEVCQWPNGHSVLWFGHVGTLLTSRTGWSTPLNRFHVNSNQMRIIIDSTVNWWDSLMRRCWVDDNNN